MVSCTGNKGDKSNVDSYLIHLSQHIPEAKTDESNIIETTSVYNPGDAIQWNKDLLIVADNVRNSLVLFHVNGNSHSSTGGKGRGPGEFEVINQLHKGFDGFLYVLDRMQVRVSQFEVGNDEIHYVQSFSPDIPNQKVLHEVFRTEAGSYALYNRTVDYTTGEISYSLYKTDEQFNPVEYLFEINGKEKISLERVGFVDHPLARHTLWGQNGNKFYTLDSHQPILNKIDFESGDISSFTIIKKTETERLNNRSSTLYLEERLEPVIRVVPALKDAIQESEQLPLYHSFFVEGGWAVITIFYAGSVDGIVLFYEMDSDKVVFARVPPHYYPFALNGKELIGINRPSQGQVDIKRIVLDWKW